ncbi:MAG: hypothetical protein ACP5G1_03380 [Nanopusillaceae archaeon]|jgi:hypothetical protein
MVNEENIPDSEKKELLKTIIILDSEKHFLGMIDKYIIMQKLCELHDDKACQVLEQTIMELKKQADNNNTFAKEILEKLKKV